MCSAFRFCLSVYFDLSPLGMVASSIHHGSVPSEMIVDSEPDPELSRSCAKPVEESARVWQYGGRGAIDDVRQTFATGIAGGRPPIRQEVTRRGQIHALGNGVHDGDLEHQ